MAARAPNIDFATVDGFGREWAAFDQSGLGENEAQGLFDAYFAMFPFARMAGAEGFDAGCGSGRWPALLAGRVGLLHCIDASEQALEVAAVNLAGRANVRLHHAGVDSLPLADGSQDFGISLGVLHHVPDTAAAIASCARKLKPGAPLLLYLYYDFENRPHWFRTIWRATDLARKLVSRLPFRARKAVCAVIAAAVYYPLARTSRLLEKAGVNVDAMPLSNYRALTFYTMRTDALDRFGTRLEQRFSRAEIRAMMEAAGLAGIEFGEGPPYWVAIGHKAIPPR